MPSRAAVHLASVLRGASNAEAEAVLRRIAERIAEVARMAVEAGAAYHTGLRVDGCEVTVEPIKAKPAKPGRDVASELRAYLLTYTGRDVPRKEAEDLVDYLKRAGWEAPE